MKEGLREAPRDSWPTVQEEVRCRSMPLPDVDSSLVGEWLDLLRRSGTDLSMAPQWFASTVRSRGAERNARVFAAFEGDRLVAVVPYLCTAEGFIGVSAPSRELPGSYLVAYHPEVVSSIDIEAVLARFADDGIGRAGVLVLPNVAKEGATARAARGLARRRGLGILTRPGHVSPYLRIQGDWEQFLSSKPKKFRYKLRAALKDIEAAGTFENRWLGTPENVERLWTDMLQIEANSWKAGAGMAINGSEMERSYYEALLPFLASEGALHANVIYLDSVPVAYSLCYLSGGGVRQLKTSFDQRYANLSPGSVVHRFAIEKAFEAGAGEFDFLGDAMQHKAHWATDVREHESIYLFLRGWRGFIVHNARRLTERVRRARPASR